MRRSASSYSAATVAVNAPGNVQMPYHGPHSFNARQQQHPQRRVQFNAQERVRQENKLGQRQQLSQAQNGSRSRPHPHYTNYPSGGGHQQVIRNHGNGNGNGNGNGIGNGNGNGNGTSDPPKVLKRELYKTEMCKSYQQYGTCRYAEKCQFAHGLEQLRPTPRHPKYKSRRCRNYATKGYCDYGSRCMFLHELGPTSPVSPSALAYPGQQSEPYDVSGSQYSQQQRHHPLQQPRKALQQHQPHQTVTKTKQQQSNPRQAKQLQSQTTQAQEQQQQQQQQQQPQQHSQVAPLAGSEPDSALEPESQPQQPQQSYSLPYARPARVPHIRYHSQSAHAQWNSNPLVQTPVLGRDVAPGVGGVLPRQPATASWWAVDAGQQDPVMFQQTQQTPAPQILMQPHLHIRAVPQSQQMFSAQDSVVPVQQYVQPVNNPSVPYGQMSLAHTLRPHTAAPRPSTMNVTISQAQDVHHLIPLHPSTAAQQNGEQTATEKSSANAEQKHPAGASQQSLRLELRAGQSKQTGEDDNQLLEQLCKLDIKSKSQPSSPLYRPRRVSSFDLHLPDSTQSVIKDILATSPTANSQKS